MTAIVETATFDTKRPASDFADAAVIPYVTAAEAERLLLEELKRLLALLDTLDAADWNRPTACSLWTVRDMVAHQAGGYASGTGYGELLHQYTALPKKGQAPEDAINARQLADRAGRSPEQLIAELRATGPRAAHNWAYGFRLFKPVRAPHPQAGWISARHLMLVIHSRDTWIHRLDICRATGKAFEQTREHDGRINELVVADLARTLWPKLGGRAIGLELTGVAGGKWKIGAGEPAATIQMDTLDFNNYASGRLTHEEIAERVVISGDNALAAEALRRFYVLY